MLEAVEPSCFGCQAQGLVVPWGAPLFLMISDDPWATEIPKATAFNGDFKLEVNGM